MRSHVFKVVSNVVEKRWYVAEIQEDSTNSRILLFSQENSLINDFYLFV